MIAMGLLCQPDLLIADEPTTALDVTVQSQINTLMGELSTKSSTAILLITHDLGVVAGLCDRVLVIYAGTEMESAGVHELFADPSIRTPKGCSIRCRGLTATSREYSRPFRATRPICLRCRRAVRFAIAVRMPGTNAAPCRS